MSELSNQISTEIESLRERQFDIECQFIYMRKEVKDLEEEVAKLEDLYYEELTREFKAEGVDIKKTPFCRAEEESV